MSTSLRPICFGLLRRRTCLLPTWRGWLALLFSAVAVIAVLVCGLFPFLAMNDPKPGGALIVEGWMPDYAFTDAIAEFHRAPYSAMLVTGGPIEKGAPFSEFRTFAEFGAATVVKLGLATAQVHAVPAPEVPQDRTYASAVAVREWLQQHGGVPAQINVMSLGAHSRRTRLLYEAAFTGVTEVGIIAIDDHSYNGRRWWASSQGVRIVIDELLAYAYARLLFRKPREF